MKYIIATALIGLLSSAATAQNGFYFAPSAGAGISTSRRLLITFDGTQNQYERSPLFSYNIQAGIGYRYKHWRFQTGIQYVRNGYKVNDVASDPASYYHTVVTKSGTYNVGFSQVGVPLQVGYNIQLNNKLSIVPYAGLYTSMTIGGSVGYKGDESQRYGVNGSQIAEYGWFTGWALAGFQMEHRLNKKISIFGGMSTQFELATTGQKGEAGVRNVHVNLGLNIGL